MKTTQRTLAVFLLLALLGCLAACNGGTTDPWEHATYKADTTLGEGATTILVEVKVDTHLITFTVNTDKTNLADALLDVDLIAGEEGQYGLYVKVVNGITADYDVDQSYWALYIGEEFAPTGISDTAVVANTTYRLAYTK